MGGRAIECFRSDAVPSTEGTSQSLVTIVTPKYFGILDPVRASMAVSKSFRARLSHRLVVSIVLLVLPAFPSSGQVAWQRAAGPFGSAIALASDGQGSIYAAMFSSDYGPPGYLYRYEADTDAWIESGLSYSHIGIHDMAFTQDGRVLIGGYFVETQEPGGLKRFIQKWE